MNMMYRGQLALLLPPFLIVSLLRTSTSYTRPDDLKNLLRFKDEMIKTRGASWEQALSTWNCADNHLNETCDAW
uniref:Uncharacterized protein n=1 Tax=Tetraselmis sp. GSL018 TaxID=582737 RepID=A0A061QM50_9CHLO